MEKNHHSWQMTHFATENRPKTTSEAVSNAVTDWWASSSPPPTPARGGWAKGLDKASNGQKDDRGKRRWIITVTMTNEVGEN